MQERPLGLTALAIASVAIGLYGLVAAMALLLGGSLGAFAGADASVPILVLGAVMFGAGMSSFFVGYGFWMKRSWAWAGKIVVVTAILLAVVAMGFLGASFTGLILPVVLGLSLISYLLRPAVRAQFVTDGAAADDADAVASDVTRGQAKVAAEIAI